MVDRALMFSYSGAIVFTSEDYYFGICRLTWAEVDWEKCGKNSRIFDRQKDEDEIFRRIISIGSKRYLKSWETALWKLTHWYFTVLSWFDNVTILKWPIEKITIIASWSQCDNLSPPQKLMDFSKEKISCQLWFADQIKFN